MDKNKLITEIERLLSNQFYNRDDDRRRESTKGDLNDMFKYKLKAFVNYLTEDLSPKIMKM